jgi:hypothetical protein
MKANNPDRTWEFHDNGVKRIARGGGRDRGFSASELGFQPSYISSTAQNRIRQSFPKIIILEYGKKLREGISKQVINGNKT